MAKKKKKNKKRKLNKKRFGIFLVIFLLFIFLIYKIYGTNISNIYIKGNYYLTDQDIIDISGLRDYPKSIYNLPYKIENNLQKNKYILSSKVGMKGFFNKIYINVEENYPLLDYQIEDKTVLYNGTKVDDKFAIATVINTVPNTVYDEFLDKMRNVRKEVLLRISEIEYKPNEVDEKRFFLLMNDGNYVYLTLDKFLNINKYLDMIKSFNGKKGILYLDSGEYFDIFDE